MSDATLRQLERRYLDSGLPEDEAAYLNQRLRMGSLRAETLHDMAREGNRGALCLLGNDSWYRLTLEDARRSFGPAPRKLGFFARRKHRIWTPFGAVDPGFRRLWRDQRKLLDHGRIVWGHVVQASLFVYESGRRDGGAIAIYSLDPKADAEPSALAQTAMALDALRDHPPDDPDLVPFADLLNDEHEAPLRRPVPPQINHGLESVLTTLYLYREHLPSRVLRGRLLPLIACPEQTPALMVLPHWHWPWQFKASWHQSVAERNL